MQGEVDGIGKTGGRFTLQDSEGKTLWSDQHTIASQADALGKVAAVLHQHLSSPLRAVGHRIVHGGPALSDHTVVTPDVLEKLEGAIHFAPLHIPQALDVLHKAQELFADTPQIACFDTAFHHNMPPTAAHLPIPIRYFHSGVRRYGFHGLSCESVLHRTEDAGRQRIIIAHLGGGSSVTAVAQGQSIDTTMGLSPTGGIPMGTRSGDLDPAVLLYMLRTEALSLDALEELVNHQCGLYALSQGESDMQALLSRTDDAARLAVDAFVAAVRKAIGGYIALLGGVDRVIFTGGIGQHARSVRERICEGLAPFGLSEASGNVNVLPADEEIQIARHCRSLLGPVETPKAR
jgi:acetate kinase